MGEFNVSLEDTDRANCVDTNKHHEEVLNV